MGGQGSKTSASQGLLNEGTQAQHFEFGVESEFWLMLEVRRSSAHSAKQLHQWMTGLLNDTTSQILGVKYLKDGEFIGTRALRPQQVLVYGKDFKTIQQTWNRLSNSELVIQDISIVTCMDKPSKSTPREVSPSAEQVRDRKLDDSNHTSVSFWQYIKLANVFFFACLVVFFLVSQGPRGRFSPPPPIFYIP